MLLLIVSPVTSCRFSARQIFIQLYYHAHLPRPTIRPDSCPHGSNCSLTRVSQFSPFLLVSMLFGSANICKVLSLSASASIAYRDCFIHCWFVSVTTHSRACSYISAFCHMDLSNGFLDHLKNLPRLGLALWGLKCSLCRHVFWCILGVPSLEPQNPIANLCFGLRVTFFFQVSQHTKQKEKKCPDILK